MCPIQRLGRSVIWTTLLLSSVRNGYADTPALENTPAASYQFDGPDLAKARAWPANVSRVSNIAMGRVLLCRGNVVIPYDVSRRAAGEKFELDRQCVRSIALFPDAKRFVTCDAGTELIGGYTPEKSIKIWSLVEKGQARSLASVDEPGPIALTPDSMRIVHWTTQGPLRVIEIDSGKTTILLPRVHCGGWSSDCAFGAFQYMDRNSIVWKVSLWDFANLREITTVVKNFGDLASMVTSRDGKTLVVALRNRLQSLGTVPRDGEIRVVDAATGKALTKFAPETGEKFGYIHDLKMSNSDKLIAATTDSGIIVCDVVRGKRIATLDEKKGASLAFVDDDKSIVCLNTDGKMTLWQIPAVNGVQVQNP